MTTLRDNLKIPNAHIKTDNNSDSAPISVVEYAEGQNKTNTYDSTYCVFDKDTHTSFNQAISKIKNNRKLIHIISNPCFEYWILLHFEYTTKSFGQSGNSPCQELTDHCLKKYLQNYCKSYKFDDKVNSKIKTAIENAKKAYKDAEKDDFKSSYTEMHILVNKFLDLQKNILNQGK
ncbi:hypothetical protein CCZ01_08400 [Helicobacter monodelphidis]|nr:hypothetical protein CCZ01_08400 [Helicobacter sp. 15-1451]